MAANADYGAGEFDRRVSARLAEWQARYDHIGVPSASPLMDRIIAEQEIAAEMASPHVEDGFGSEWPKCERPDCGLEVVRPGKVQCWCDDPSALPPTNASEAS